MSSFRSNVSVASLSLLLSLAAQSLYAQTLVIPSSTATSVALSAGSQYQVLSNQRWTDYEDLIEISILNEVLKLAANNGVALDSADYNNTITLLRTHLDQYAPSAAQFRNQDPATRLRYGIDMLCIHGLSPQPSPLVLQALFNVEKLKFRLLESTLDVKSRAPADVASYSASGLALQFTADQVQQAADLAFLNAQFASAVNPILKDLTGFDTTNSYVQIRARFTGLPTLPVANVDGSFTVTKQSLVAQYQSVIGSFQSGVDKNIATFEAAQQSKAPIAENGATIKLARLVMPMGRNGENKAQLKLRLAAQVATAGGNGSAGVGGTDISHCEPCKTAQSSVTAVSKLVGLSDSSLASQISAVGTSAISAGLSISQLLSATTTGAMLGPAGALVASGVTIFSSLFGGGGGADAAVLAQLQKISNQIASLQKDMDAQFAIVDKNLSTILKTLQSNFQQINYTLGTLTGNVQSIQQGLLDIQTQLNQLAWYNSYYHQAEEQDALMLSVNDCINYRSNHDNKDIGARGFDACENTFFTYAQTNAQDGIWAPIPSPSAYADNQVFDTMSNFHNQSYTPCANGCPTPFAVLINFLAQYPANNLGQSPLSSTVPLANPDEWSLGARAYLEMLHEFPQYSMNRGLSYFDQMIAIGTDVQQAVENVNSSRPPGQPIVSNHALLNGPNGLTAKYSSAITTLQKAINAEVNSYLSNPAHNISQPDGVALSIWAGGSNQHTSVRPWTTINICGGVNVGAAPSALLAQIPDLFIFSQEYFGGQIAICLTQPQWVNSSSRQSVDSAYLNNGAHGQIYPNYPTPPPPPVSVQAVTGTLVTTMNVTFNGASIFSTTVSTSAIQELVGVSGLPGLNRPPIGFHYFFDPTDTLTSNWTAGLSFESLFNSSSLVAQQPQEIQIIGSIASQLDSLTASHQSAIYKLIASDLGAQNDVQRAASLLDGDKLLLQGYANVGLPISLQYDSSLHGSLYGSQAIFDSSVIQQDFIGFGNASTYFTTDNEINDEIASITSRVNKLSSAMDLALSRIDQSQVPESLPQVDIALEDLEAYEALQSLALTLNKPGILSPCDYHLSGTSSAVNAAGGKIRVAVDVVPGCTWRASTNSPWLLTTSGQTGSGSGAVVLLAKRNKTSSPRAGDLLVGDQLVRVSQDSASDSTKKSGGGVIAYIIFVFSLGVWWALRAFV